MNKLIKPFIGIAAVCLIFVVAALITDGCTENNSDPLDDISIEDFYANDGDHITVSYDNFSDLCKEYAEKKGINEDDIDEEKVKDWLSGRLKKEISDLNDEDITIQIRTLKVVVYLDNTSSMKGFLQPANKNISMEKFVSVFNKLRSKYGDTIPSYYIDKEGFSQTSLSEMTKSLNDKKIVTRDAYVMSAFLDSVVTRALSDNAHRTLSLFVTDAIISGTNDQITANGNYNIEHAETLSKDIEGVIGKLKDKDYGFELIRLTAPFDGDYINYHNGHTKLNNVDRPYFIIAIGHKKDIRKLENSIAQDKLLDPSIKRMLSTNVPCSPSISSNSDELKKDEDDPCRFIYETEQNQDDDAHKFSINIVIDNLPEYYHDQKTVSDAIQIYDTDGKIINTDLRYDSVQRLATFSTIKKESQKYTVKIKNIPPAWVTMYNSNNDENFNGQTDKTFNLEWLVKGFVNGLYGTGSTGYICNPVTFSIEIQ